MLSLVFFVAFFAFRALASPVPTSTPSLRRQDDWQLPLLSFLDAKRILTISETKPPLTRTANTTSPSASSVLPPYRVDNPSRASLSPSSLTYRIHPAFSSSHRSSPHHHSHPDKLLHPTPSRAIVPASTHHTHRVLHYRPLPIPIPFPHPFPPLPTISRGLHLLSSTGTNPSSTAPPPVIGTAIGNDTNDLSQVKKLRTTLACVGSFALLVIVALGFTTWRWRPKTPSTAFLDGGLLTGTSKRMPEDKQTEGPNPDPQSGDAWIVEKEPDTLTLPQSLRDFSSSVNQVLRIGRGRDSSNESSSESVEIGRDRAIKYPSSHGSLNLSLAEDGSFIDQDNITENSTRSPLDIDGGFAAELAFAFSIPSTVEHEFPSSPIHYSTSSSPASLFTSVRQARGVNPINHSTPVQSIRASITEALSMISVPERLSGSAIMFDRKSPKSAKSIHSEKSSRFRFSRGSLSLDKRRRKSVASVVTRSSSKPSLPSPDTRDVAILFSGSQESIQIGMPSAPPTSFSGAPPTFLGPYIPHSPIFLPATLISALPNPLEPSVFEPILASTPRRNRHVTRLLATPSRRHSSAVKSSLIFDQSLFLLPPASPSSDGLSHGGGLESSSDSMSSFGLIIPNRSDLSLPGREKTSPRIPTTPNSMERSPPRALVHSSPSPSPEKSQRSVLASLSMKSLVLKAAVDSLVAAQFSPPHGDDKQIDISPRRSLEKGDARSDGSDEKTRVSPPTVSVADYDWSNSSMDITVTHRTANLGIDEIDGLPNSKGFSTSKSGHSLIIEDLLEKRGHVGPTLAEEASLDGMENMCEDSLYPSGAVQSHPRLAIHRGASCALEVDGFSTQSIVIADVLEGEQNDVILAAKPSLDRMGNLDEGLYPKSNSVSTQPRVVPRTTHPPPVKSVGISPSPDTPNENEERSVGDKSHLRRNAGRPLSLTLSHPSGRLAISVIPQLDDEMRHLETMLMGVSSMEEIDLGSLHGTLEDDESDTGSFEGQLTDISTYHRTHFVSGHGHGIGDSDAGNNGWSKVPIDKEEYSDEYAYGDEGDDAAYDSSLNYLSDTYPILPRQAEVALRAIEREGGRAIEGEQIVRHLDASRGPGQNFAPAISSPLRVSHRLSVASVNSLASKVSEGSQYSQTSIAAAAMMGITSLRS